MRKRFLGCSVKTVKSEVLEKNDAGLVGRYAIFYQHRHHSTFGISHKDGHAGSICVTHCRFKRRECGCFDKWQCFVLGFLKTN